MPITVHTISGAPRAWRVLMGLTFKGLEWDTALLQASTRDHKAPTFLELNPRGTVPVLEADGRIIGDGKPGDMTKRLQSLHREFAFEHGTPLPV